ncbi:AGE family epimerase/isomerase [Spirosoma sp. KUDC1026]|uniref:AGE family epimerase/isomerase n=1 Tax=Spirosoma sp. KUDC1026 TaxID=2745947 RepID=UPI00159BE320|nr:AGE family epimerase/isomerase [Spirosoma sp. KUDC1026]QKZ11430.1 AGE family epimerase/isomerase [Spirosoma sp. KUDC1026]
MLDFPKLSADYQQALLRQVVPFGLNHSRDELCGGYFDTLTATGEVIESDKSVALQAQQVWAFAWLYNTLDAQPGWLSHARYGAEFLSQFAHDQTLACYAELDRRGRPVAPALNGLPDSFTALAYTELYRATSEDEWAMLAKQLYTGLRNRWQSARLESAPGGFRDGRWLEEATAQLKVTLEMKSLLAEDVWKEDVQQAMDTLLHTFLDRRTGLLRNYVLSDGGFVNTPKGRRLNVGLICQTASYLLDLCKTDYQSVAANRKLATQVVDWCLHICELAWSESTGGLNTYVDFKNQPAPEIGTQYKWAWIQLEALSALIKGYTQTANQDCLKWFKRVHEYTFQHFPDVQHVGWHQVVDHNAQPALPTKATSDLGFYSQIKCLAETAQTLTTCKQVRQSRPFSRFGT